MPTFEYELNAKAKGYKFVCGVDEAGRGPLAGPVCAAAVILPENCVIEGLNDSKKLTAAKREKLIDEIKEKAIAWSVAYASVEEIENVNILNATYLAMNRAIEGLDVPADYALIDGNRVPKNIKVPCETVIKGDALSYSIAAASIIAKVTRDKIAPTHITTINESNNSMKRDKIQPAIQAPN
jgi:ribonuclease HII